ncbi:MAG TPA: FAD-dependent monooxygenase [Pseudonocardia sp.]|nr:FAD-dependent monooxygenase [Pseudonocardia sp.]
MDTDVLVVGAGPVGLLLATELRLAGARVEVVERLATPTGEKKARGIGSLATEALRRRGLGPLLAEYHERGSADFRAAHGSDKGHFAWLHKIDLVPADEPDRGYTFIWQPDLEQVLGDRAAELGVPVHREHELTGFAENADGVTATLRTPAGERRLTASYLVGCDGGRSGVRKLTGFEFPGTAPFMVMRAGQVELADASVLPPPGRRDTGQLMHGGGLLGTAEFDSFPEHRDAPLTVEELTDSVRRVAGVDVTITALREPRRVLDHARQAATYRLGRVLLAGDAAHVHSPNGGQGLNLGLMDAMNLGWKLAAAVRGTDPKGELLDSYTAERHPVAAAVLHNTRAQSALLAPGPHHEALRDIIADLMDLPEVNRFFGELMNGVHTRYALPYRTGAEPELVGQHSPELAVDDTSLYRLATAGRPLLVTGPAASGAAEVAAPWADRVELVAASTLGRADLAGLLLRPDGVLAWACAPGGPVDLEQLRTALATWFGEPTGG